MPYVFISCNPLVCQVSQLIVVFAHRIFSLVCAQGGLHSIPWKGKPMEKSADHEGPVIQIGASELIEFLRVGGRILLRALVGGFVGGILGFFIGSHLRIDYISEAFLEVSTNPIQKVLDSRADSDFLAAKSDSTSQVKTVEVLAETQNVLNTVTSRLNEKGLNTPVSFSARSIHNTRLLRLQATSSSAKESIQGVNFWAQAVVDVLGQQRAEMFQKGDALLGGPYEKLCHEMEGLQSQIKRLKPQLAIQQAELESRQSMVIGQIKELMLIDPAIDQNSYTLPVMKEEMKKHKLIFPNAPVAGGNQDVLPLREFPLGVESGTKIQGIITYGANPLYLDLQKKISDMAVDQETLVFRRNQLKNSIKENKTLIDRISGAIITSSVSLDRLERDYEIANKSFIAICSNMGETRLAGSVPMANVRIASQAVVPGEKTKVKAATSFFSFLGFLGVFIFFSFRVKPGVSSIFLNHG